MTKFLAILSLFVALAAATQSCSYGENLRDLYGLDNTLTAPKAYSTLKYCTSLASGSCCTDTDINTLGDFSAEYTKNITTLVSTRDTYLKNIKDNVLPTLLTNIKDFNTAAAQFQANIEKELSSANIDLSDLEVGSSDEEGSDGGISIDIDPMELLSGLEELNNMTTTFVAQLDSIKANYGTYQTDRRTCVIEMIDLQNSAICLSCDPNIETKGFTDFLALYQEIIANGGSLDGTDDTEDSEDGGFDLSDLTNMGLFGFTIADSVCTRLQNSCKPYLAAAVGQNQLVEAVLAAQLFSGLTKALQLFNSGDIDGGIAQFITVFTEASASADVTTPALMEGALPPGCDTNGECEWICDGLFTNGMVDALALIIGGDYDVSLDGEVEDSDEEGSDSDGGRRLAAVHRKLTESSSGNGEWAPAEGSSGVKVDFAVDPANTNTASKKFGSLSLGNVFVGMMVVISSILLF